MDLKQTSKIVTVLKTAFPGGGWTQGRFSLYAEHLGDLPFRTTVAVVDRIVKTWPETFCPAIGRIRAEVEARMRRNQAIADQRRERLELAGPKDPVVRETIRNCIARLEQRANGWR